MVLLCGAELLLQLFQSCASQFIRQDLPRLSLPLEGLLEFPKSPLNSLMVLLCSAELLMHLIKLFPLLSPLLLLKGF